MFTLSECWFADGLPLFISSLHSLSIHPQFVQSICLWHGMGRGMESECGDCLVSNQFATDIPCIFLYFVDPIILQGVCCVSLSVCHHTILF